MINSLDRIMGWLGSPDIVWPERWDDDGGNAVAAEITASYWAMSDDEWASLKGLLSRQGRLGPEFESAIFDDLESLYEA